MKPFADILDTAISTIADFARAYRSYYQRAKLRNQTLDGSLPESGSGYRLQNLLLDKDAILDTLRNTYGYQGPIRLLFDIHRHGLAKYYGP